ncbi:MAG TPA: UvrD-helicase domain-containing protein [Acidimicrobiia bacterium]|nr:UvrD-helicase domain-containing protein [Acidimicrobiia bacterium]
MTEQQVWDPEINSEQAYLDAAYARLESMRGAARQVQDAYSDVRAGGTHQARLERDIAHNITQRRLADLEIGETPLAFGRLDLESGDPYYIGRLAVEDADHSPLVIDWRAPVAEPFYRATAVAPMGVVRRRHFITRHGREIIALDDEVFDRDASESAGLQVSGEGALLGALERDRTGRMGDIVATIQFEQDEAIRAELPGILVVGGGPGTGKTAVALHRAAYLLYTHRRRLASQGVLLIGPSPVFLRYIEQVLPSLGEQDVQLSTLAGLKPQLDARRRDPRPVAALKGDGRMAKIIAKAVSDRQRPLPRDLNFVIDGLRVTLRRDDSARVVHGARRQRGTHNERRRSVVRRTIDMLVARYKTAAIRAYQEARVDNGSASLTLFGGSRGAISGPDPLIGRALSEGDPLPEGWEKDLGERIRRRPEVREALDRMWPVISGPELVNDLLGFRALVRSAASGILDADEQDRLHRPRAADVAHASWTDSDVAVIDEADALLGPVEAARPRSRRRRGHDAEALETAQGVVAELGLSRSISGASLLARYGENGDGEPSDLPEPRVFGHVLVDEAQDLNAMQWRMLSRRCPSGSMTLVGDPAQASRAAAVADWDSILALLPRHTPPRATTLTVNYRTPSEIMDVANRLLAAAAPTVEPSRSVRSTGERPQFVAVAANELVARAAEVAAEASDRGGKVALIAPTACHADLVDRLAARGAASDPAVALDAPIAVLDATDAKGLEFDHVVVVEPAELVQTDRAGLRLLYVTITRATKTLAVVHAQPLPEALDLI